MKKFLKTVVVVVIIGTLGYYFRAPLSGILARLQNQFLPCYQPIAYSLGTFDAKFGISKTDFLAALKQAEALWEKPVGKDLFSSTTDGALKINLLYDSRQEATVTLKKLGITVDENRASYDALKAEYNSLITRYSSQKAEYTSWLTQFNRDQDAYNAEVSRSNNRGGASKTEYARLTAEKAALDERARQLEQARLALNANVDTTNALATALNDLAAKLNISVAKFNEVGESRGEEFNEGLYVSEATGQHIDIYEYSSRAKLIRVLAHELGHALGLDHVADPQAIMYRLNQASAEKLTADDLTALKARCGIQ